jgi:phage terminase Nu1 subunit (DNA packaging protein)
MEITRTEAVKHFGVSYGAIDSWRRRGCPCRIDHGHVLLDTEKVEKWRSANQKTPTEDDTTLTAERRRKVKAEADLKQIELARLRGELISVDQVIRDLSTVITNTKIHILGWCKSLPSLLFGKEEKQIVMLLRTETYRVLNELADGAGGIAGRKHPPRSKRKRPTGRG